MTKAVFYLCITSGDGAIAEKVSGYSDGDIGVHKVTDYWIATHIPTGLRVTPIGSKHKTAKSCFSEGTFIFSA